MKNVPKVMMGIVAVSRDCFPLELSRKRRIQVVAECVRQQIPVVELQTIVENEHDVMKALKEIQENGINALVIYLGNFGPKDRPRFSPRSSAAPRCSRLPRKRQERICMTEEGMRIADC